MRLALDLILLAVFLVTAAASFYDWRTRRVNGKRSPLQLTFAVLWVAITIGHVVATVGRHA